MRTETPSPILVAPRPVRIAPGGGGGAFANNNAYSFMRPAQHVRLVSAPVAEHTQSQIDEGLEETLSTRSSPRSPLPSEALEEFLSILKPSLPAFFPPRSPVTVRSRRQVSLPQITYNEKEATRNVDMSASAKTPESDGVEVDFQVLEIDDSNSASPSFRWFTSSVLSSPISRSNTRNPFQRHASPLYQRQSPANPQALVCPSLSPAAIPLPLPTADDL
ncbi:hypothetical protein V5O48_009726 [Marasmius crinis-equi]|uniref:Uncharacterized protein n=1 Tax=Marasmius crinis-equi TaxID=585013 RepID=A0ABR3FB24_9AGAR